MAVDDEISRLYGLPLEEFVAERNRAAREARKAGRPEDAAAIAELRKPSIAAWAINQLARDRRRDVDLLLDSGKRLLNSQRSSLEGQGRSELDRARESLDKAVARLVAAARVFLEGRASETTLSQIDESLRIAAISAEGRELLALGTLTGVLQGTGWDVLEGLAADLPSGPGPSKTPERRKRSQSKETAQLGAARAAVREAKARRAEAARAVREAEREQAGARQALDAADARLESARRTLAEAEAQVARAERMLRER